MTLSTAWRQIAVVLVLAVSAAAETASVASATPVASAEARVISALTLANIPTEHGKLQFLAPVGLNDPAGVFTVVGIEKWQETSAMVRIRCVKSGDCMPFFVMLRWPSAAERDAALRAPVLLREHAARRETKIVLVRAGQQATLILQNDKFRIVTPVTCLENGSRGQKIRVRSADHKKVRVAEVEDSGLLKGTL